MAATTLTTSDQFLALPDEFDERGNRIKDELIGGEIVKVPPASKLHDLIKNRVNALLLRFLDLHPELELIPLVEIGALVSDLDTFIPDVSVIQRSRLATPGRIFQQAPDIAIEVVSPTDTARHLKRKVKAYLENGAQSVWIVYPEDRSVMVHSATSVREAKNDDSVTDALLPGFSCGVADFFELT